MHTNEDMKNESASFPFVSVRAIRGYIFFQPFSVLSVCSVVNLLLFRLAGSAALSLQDLLRGISDARRRVFFREHAHLLVHRR